MPRKIKPLKFKYTVRKGDDLYVKYPLPGFKYPIWRKCEPETQERVDEIINVLLYDFAQSQKDAAIPDLSAQFFDFWLEMAKTRLSPRTWQDYKDVIQRNLKPALGNLPLSDVKPLHLQNLYQTLSASGLEAITIRKTHRVASVVFKEAVNLDLIAQNPVARSKPPKINESLKVKVMSQVEVKRFLGACQNSPYGIIFEFALETGMRPQEYLALRWTDLDFERQSVEVVRALVYDRKGGGFYFKEPKTRKSRRTIPLSAQLCDKLRVSLEKQNEYLAEIAERIRRRAKPSRLNRREHNKKLLENHKALNLVFPSQHFTPFKDINLGRRYFKTIAASAGLDKSLTLYSLRHTSISLLVMAGVSIKTVSERAGHSNVSTTLNIYTHVIGDAQEKATEKLSNLLY